MVVRFYLINLIIMASYCPSFLWRPVALFDLWQVVAFWFQWRLVADGKLSLMASCRLWQVVVYGKLSLMASCRLWQVVALRISLVHNRFDDALKKI